MPDTTAQNSNDATALLTCVMCGGENALDATQCQSCGATLQPASTASTRAPLLAATKSVAAGKSAARIDSGAATKIAAPKPDATSEAAPRENQPAPNAAQQEAARRATLQSAISPTATSTRGASQNENALATATSAGSAIANAASNANAASADEANATTIANAKATPEVSIVRAASSGDARQVQALLDRAFMLAEGGHIDAAILACSEAAAMQPQSAAAHSMLGLLLERDGDLEGAMKAYGRTLRIEPENRLARDSIARLQELAPRESGKNTGAETTVVASAVPPAERREYSQSGEARNATHVARENLSENAIPVRTSADATIPAKAGVAPATSASAAGKVASAPGRIRGGDLPSAEARSEVLRATTPQSGEISATQSVARAATSARATMSKTASTRDDADDDDWTRAMQSDISALADEISGSIAGENETRDENASRENLSRWNFQKLRSSYFVRSLPLVMVTLLGTWFLFWASARAPQKVASTRVMAAATPVPAATPTVVVAPTSAPELSVQEQLAAAVAAARAATPIPTATPIIVGAPPATGNATTSAATLAPPSTPTGIAEPAGAGTANTVSPAMPSPNLATPIAPAFPNASVTPQTAPTPAGDSTNFERAAQLQTRALSAIEAGDNAAAARGFGDAIAAYNAQIATGFRADESRDAIAACREGIRLAEQLRR